MLLRNPNGILSDCPVPSPSGRSLGTRRASPPRASAPLSGGKWAVLSPIVLSCAAPGRPARERRRGLDAIPWLAARPVRAVAPWHPLPASSGEPDNASQQFGRRAEQGFWSRPVRAIADSDHPGIRILRCSEGWSRRPYRRSWRIRGAPGPALAGRLGVLSALRAPTTFLPDADLSEDVQSRPRPVLKTTRDKGVRVACAPTPCPTSSASAARCRRAPAAAPPYPSHRFDWP